MLYLAFIYHMHQPYYKNLLTQETEMPWVRLHGIKDYLDMVQILEKYPAIHQTFNLVPSLIEQIQDYASATVKDKFLEFSYKPASELTQQDKDFIRKNFFMINRERVISIFPRYYELYLRQAKSEFNMQDYLDLQVWFNLAWFDPYFRDEIPELKRLVDKARFFTEEEKRIVLDKQKDILKEIVPAYKKFMDSGQVEVIFSPYYHPILPLLYNTKIAKEANIKTILHKVNFSYPEDAQAQIQKAVEFYKSVFNTAVSGMWPSEESVCEHILPQIINAGVNWIVADEAVLFKSLKAKKRYTNLLYQPHLLKRKEGDLNIIFRDRNLSDLIGFIYYNWKAEDAVSSLIRHFEDIANVFKEQDILVTVAMDGENAWEYYANDGHNFLELFYQRLSESKIIKSVTVNEYLKMFPPKHQIQRLAAGSWIFCNFGKWIDNPYKAKAWECLAKAREELADFKFQMREEEDVESHQVSYSKLELAYKQIYIAEGSDWFWWYGEKHSDFDRLFRTHLCNFYTIIEKPIPDYLKTPLES